MKHSNISIFVPHIGCPNMCSFCNQHTISGTQKAPDADEVRKICEKALLEIKHPQNTEIAFFGGSFTAITRDYMTALLEAAYAFVGDGMFSGIRISTRPDCIDEEILGILKRYGVKAIELGAQSMSDMVLKSNDRGHTAEDVEKASRLIRKNGFELGLQMMTGLYKSTLMDDMDTARYIADLKPDTVRIYPVVVLKGTRLAELYKQGEYEMISLNEMMMFCANLICFFEEHNIKIIKCGLHASEFVEQDMVAGYYHPAFREMCETYIYRDVISRTIRSDYHSDRGNIVVEVNDKCVSKAVGQNKINPEYFRKQGIELIIKGNENIPKYQCKLRR